MKYIEIISHQRGADAVVQLHARIEAQHLWLGPVDNDGTQQMRLLVRDDQLQDVLDELRTLLVTQQSTQITVLPVDLTLPEPTRKDRKAEDAASAAREALYAEVEKGAQLDSNFLLLVVLSAIVAALGLLEDSVAVVIGAMVIAPLLGPNLALSLGTALGDVGLVHRAVKVLCAGVLLALAVALCISLIWPYEPNSQELLARTQVGLGSVVLALVSGAAGALSLMSGLSGTLVGVMVAVALMPPITAVGLLLGKGELELALNAGLLFAINVVSVNLASKVVFALKGVRPRTWYEKDKARQAMQRYLIGWLLTLGVLLVVLYMRSKI